MSWDLPSALVDWAQVVGSFLGLVAIVVAYYALWRQRRDVGVERRTQHQIEVLRDLAAIINERHGYQQAYLYLLMIDDRLPKVRETIEAVANVDVGPMTEEYQKGEIWTGAAPLMVADIRRALMPLLYKEYERRLTARQRYRKWRMEAPLRRQQRELRNSFGDAGQ